MARQFEIKSIGWEDANLLVGWDPALRTYYAQISDSKIDQSGPLMWLTPKPSIQGVQELEKYINASVKGRWPAIELIPLARLNLELDRFEESGGQPPEHYDPTLKPPSVSSSGIVFGYDPESSGEDSVEDLKDWFLDNYEDPAEQTSYNGREGGYLYIHGGPYNPNDELFQYWADVYPEEIINAAAKAIEEETGIYDWAPAGWRVVPERDFDDKYEREFKISPAQYQDLRGKVDELEAVFDQIGPPGSESLIGHNNPPDSIDYPISLADHAFVREFITKVKQSTYQTLKLSQRIAGRFSRISRCVLEYVAKHADLSATKFNEAFSDTAGKFAAKALAGYALWKVFGLKLEDVAKIIETFAN